MLTTPKLIEPSDTPSSVRLYAIPSKDIDSYWVWVAPLLDKAVSYSDGKYDLPDVYDGLKAREMQLFIIVDDTIRGVFVTQVHVYPRKNVLVVMFLAGEDFDEWSYLYPHLESWATELGCECIEMWGRVGWQKKLKPMGWEHTMNVMRKEL